jgi:IS5 family transposase
VNADAKHKLIRRYEVTDAAVHDNRKLDGLLTKGDTSAEVFADSAYRSARIEAQLRASGSRPGRTPSEPSPVRAYQSSRDVKTTEPQAILAVERVFSSLLD